MKKLLCILLAALLLTGVAPAALASSTRTVYVSSTGSGTLNLRSGPGKGYESKGYVHHGNQVIALGTSGEWSKVRTASGKVGWIKTKYIDGTTEALGSGTRTVKVPGGDALNLRSGPGTHYSVRGTVSSGATVSVLNTENDWVRVSVAASGKIGWIKAKYIGASSGGASGSGGDASPATLSVYRVTGASLNVRQGAGTGYGVVTTLPLGTPFKVMGMSGNWFKIATFNDITGWVSRSYAAVGADATVTASSLNLRAGAGTGSRVLRSLAFGTRVTVNGIAGSWAKISCGGLTGYVSLNYLNL